ncbi:MAG TPA: hypothetical protein VGA36_10600, partial [Nitriliruptorales bacterium]
PRVYSSGRDLQVVHDDGRVIAAVDTREGVVTSRYAGPVPDPDELLDRSGADRVILVDRSLSDGLATSLLTASRNSPTQAELFWNSQAAFWAHPAVSVRPPVGGSVWPGLHARLKELGPQVWAVLGAWRGDELALSLIVRFRDGDADLITSADHFGLRPPRAEAHRLVDAVSERGPVELALLCDLSDLESVIAAPDPWAQLRAVSGRALASRGLDRMLP